MLAGCQNMSFLVFGMGFRVLTKPILFGMGEKWTKLSKNQERVRKYFFSALFLRCKKDFLIFL